MTIRAVITGVGTLSTAGRGTDALASAITGADCRVRPDDDLRALGTRGTLSGRLEGVDEAFAQLPIDRAHRGFFGRFSRIGAIAALDALDAAGAPAVGRVIVASGVGPMGELEACFRDTLLGERHVARPYAVTRVTPSFLATWLAAYVGAPRGGHTVSAACVSAVEALRSAVELVAAGIERACLVGAVEEDAASTYWAFDAQRLLGRATAPDLRTRALSGKMGGFLPAGGAAFFVVEAEDAARERGRTPLVRFAGISVRSMFEAAPERSPSLVAFPRSAYVAAVHDVTASSGDGVDLVLAHAPPSVADQGELEALDDALGIVAAATPVRSYKSLLGYALGAGAALDVALGVEQIARGAIWPNDPAPLEDSVARFTACLGGGERAQPVSRVLKTAYAQGGAAGAIVLERATAPGSHADHGAPS